MIFERAINGLFWGAERLFKQLFLSGEGGYNGSTVSEVSERLFPNIFARMAASRFDYVGRDHVYRLLGGGMGLIDWVSGCSMLPISQGQVNGGGSLVAFMLLCLGMLSCAVILQEIKHNDFPYVTHKLLRIVMNKSILYAGMTLTYGFTWKRACMGLGQISLFLLLYVSQYVTNRRMSNQIQNSCTSCGLYIKHLVFSCVTCATGLAGIRMCLMQWGFNSFGLVCALDSLGLVILSIKGIMVYCIKACAVVFNLELKKKGAFLIKDTQVHRKPTAEMAFCTEMDGFMDAALEICFYCTTLMEYFALYMFRDGIFIHIFDLAILLDVRYLISHSKRRIAKYNRLHQRSQFVTKSLPRVIYSDSDDAVPSCPICIEDMHVGRKLGCGHVYHVKCLLGWVKECDGQSCTCPLCRSDLVTGHFCDGADNNREDDWIEIEDVILHDLFSPD